MYCNFLSRAILNSQYYGASQNNVKQPKQYKKLSNPMADLKMPPSLFFFTCFCLLMWDGAQARQCVPLITEGYTYPAGDITLESGEDLNITCVLNNVALAKYGPFPSKKMSFVMTTNRSLPVEILNSTAIRLNIENHPKTQSADYYCLLNHSFVCHNVVAVGTKPQNITDFDCMGHNLENFTCTWTVPENYVNTTYELEYAPALRSSRSYSQCPNSLEEKTVGNRSIMSCTWALSTTPQYRHSHKTFTFNLYANNTFGERNWTYTIPHYRRVRPNRPEHFAAISKSPHSIKLFWEIPMYMLDYPDGLRFRVSWCIEQSKKWTTIYLPNETFSDLYNITKKNVSFILDDLPYAHFIYDIRVSIQPTTAIDDRMWSQNASATVRTLSEIPDCPPNTTLGSFEILDGVGKRHIYWQTIHSYQENGENFTYSIEATEEPALKPTNIYNKYALFNYVPNKNITFKIWSINSEGRSKEVSTVFLPAEKFVLKSIRKLIKEDKGNGEYNLQWMDGGNTKVENYTLFWCSAQMERPYPCEGTLQWMTVARGSKNQTLKLPVFDYETNKSINNYQFAMSVNGFGSSSGLLWADCTVLSGRGKRKLSQTYFKAVSSRYIVLQIHLGCITLTDIQGFNVSYCQIPKPASEECQPRSLKYKFFNVNNDTFGGEAELNITNLTPYTGYQIRVKPIVKGSEVEFGDFMFNATSEDIPSEPRNLKILRREGRVLTAQWDIPAETNGVIRNYQIIVKSGSQSHPIVTVDAPSDVATYSANITNLIPRTSYVIDVAACTINCSVPASINTSTDITYPGYIKKPSANWENSITIIKWEKPDEPQTLVDFYELQIGTNNVVDQLTYHNTTDEFFSLGEICQGDKFQTIYVKVRGVNIRYGQLLKGNWSDKTDFPCIRDSTSTPWVIILIGLSILLVIVGVIYTAKRTLQKVLGMRHCPVKLPPGLDAVSNVEYSMAEIQGDKKGVTSIRAPTAGYVQCFPEEPNAKNTSYVMAGNPISVPPIKQASSGYVVPEDISIGNFKVPPIESLKLLWQKPAPEVTSAGYVLVGDSKNQKSDAKVPKADSKPQKTEPVNLKGSKLQFFKTLKED